MKRFHAWLRVISPAGWVVLGTWALCALVVVVQLLSLTLFGGNATVTESRSKAAVGVRFLTCAGAIAYACLRAWYFHPAARKGYYHWLCLMPWQAPRRLPLGPITLCIQDVFWMLLLLAPVLACGSTWGALVALGLAVCTYCMLMSYTFLRIGPYWAGYACWLLFSSVAWTACLAYFDFVHVLGQGLNQDQWFTDRVAPNLLAASFLFLGVLCAISQFALRQQLRRFPWGSGAEAPTNLFTLELTDVKVAGRQRRLGWPLAIMRPNLVLSTPLAPVERVAICFFLAIQLGCFTNILVHIRQLTDRHADAIEDSRPILFILTTFVSLCCWVPSILTGIPYYRSPISLLGRLATRHWIIPGYDRRWIKPGVSSWIVVAGGLMTWQVPGFVIAIVFGTTLLVGLWNSFAKPNLDEWSLLGQYRLVNRRSEGSAAIPYMSRPMRQHFWS